MSRKNQTKKLNQEDVELEVEEYLSQVDELVAKLDILIPSNGSDNSFFVRMHESLAISIALCFPNLSDDERKRIAELTYLGDGIGGSRLVYDSAVREKPAAAIRIKLATNVVKAEQQYLRALEAFKGGRIYAKLSRFQKELVKSFVQHSPLKGFNPSRSES